jgi:hypothetical protein
MKTACSLSEHKYSITEFSKNKNRSATPFSTKGNAFTKNKVSFFQYYTPFGSVKVTISYTNTIGFPNNATTL